MYKSGKVFTTIRITYLIIGAIIVNFLIYVLNKNVFLTSYPYVALSQDVYSNMYNEGFTKQDDTGLVKYIRTYWIHPPSNKSYRLSDYAIDNVYTSENQQTEKVIDRLLKGKRNGFFVECGAYDGQYVSNSLFFERFRNWSGILVEAQPEAFERLKQVNRRSYSINTCLSIHNHTNRVTFLSAGPQGGIYNQVPEIVKPLLQKRGRYTKVEVQCFTIYSILLSINVLHIDYFSLDVEGAETKILKTIPFDKVYIYIFTIEYVSNTAHHEEDIRDFFKKLGTYQEIVGTKITSRDLLFVHK